MSCDFTALLNIDAGDPDQATALLQECTAVMDDPMLWVWAVVFTVVCALVGAWIGKYKRAVWRDLILGLTLGPIGWVISLCLPARSLTCPNCGTHCAGSDRYCRNCGSALSAKPALRKP